MIEGTTDFADIADASSALAAVHAFECKKLSTVSHEIRWPCGSDPEETFIISTFLWRASEGNGRSQRGATEYYSAKPGVETNMPHYPPSHQTCPPQGDLSAVEGASGPEQRAHRAAVTLALVLEAVVEDHVHLACLQTRDLRRDARQLLG